MWEYYIMYKDTGEKDCIFGYNEADAARRASLLPSQYTVLMRTYVD